MKIVIDIPEEDYIRLRDTGMFGNVTTFKRAVREGVPLPKGHGRIIDEKKATDLIAKGKNGDKAYFGTVNKDWEVIDFLKTIPTIIEADKAESEVPE